MNTLRRITAAAADYTGISANYALIFTAGANGGRLDSIACISSGTNVAAVLRDAGATLADVVTTTVFVKDFAEYAVFDSVWQECFGAHRPARATVKAELVHPALLIEIQAIAVRPAGRKG